MKRKIVIYMVAILLLFTAGAIISILYITNTVSELNNIIKLHQVEMLRRSLLINLQAVQSDLYTVNTVFAQDADLIVKNVTELEATSKECSSCHHPPHLNTRIVNVQSLINDYENLLSFYITSTANEERTRKLRSDAAEIGKKILKEIENMSHSASDSLVTLTKGSTDKIADVKKILFLTIIISLTLGIIAAMNLVKSITRPINKLLEVTGMISAGKLGTTISHEDETEFGELSKNFNVMSIGLKESYDGLQKEIIERIQTEEELRISRERYELAAEGANDGLWDWDIKSNVIYFSPRWKAMLGYEDKDIKSNIEEWFKRIHTDDRKHVETELKSHIDGVSHQFQNEHRILHKAGGYRWVLTRGLAVRDQSGRAYRVAGSQTDITERKLAEEQLLHDAFHDSLTGLPNRALFMDRLTHAIRRSTRGDKNAFAVLFIDMDRFKVVNDSLGHIIGDQLLVVLSRKLLECLRPGDTIARFGGDEFAVLLEDIKDQHDVTNLIGRIQERLSSPFTLNEQDLFITVSIGVCFSNERLDNPDEILRNADIAMYHAKANGRNRYQVFNENMYESVVASMRVERDLRKAVDNKEFELQYQPVMSLKTGKVTGFEALIRWRHPVHGLIQPSEFIQIAEETGLIVPIGEWVLYEACRQMQEWQKIFQSNNPLTVSVNVSGRQLIPELVEQVRKALQGTDIQKGSLVLEITETVLMEKAELISPLLQKLKELDVKLQIDDFGTGYSSLSYLHTFPLDALKIDRSFISKLDSKEDKLEIVRTITNLAVSLKMYVIAEGVETEEQLDKLRRLNCENIQGYLLSRPLDSNTVENFLNKKSWESFQRSSI